MKEWIVEYLKQSLLFKSGFLNLLWILISFIESRFHNPSFWNYFNLMRRAEYGTHTNETLCSILHYIAGVIVIISAIHFISIEYKGLIHIYTTIMSCIIVFEIFSLVTRHDDVCMFISMGLEILYLAGLASEITIKE